MTAQELQSPLYSVTCDRCGVAVKARQCPPTGWADVSLSVPDNPWSGQVCGPCLVLVMRFLTPESSTNG